LQRLRNAVGATVRHAGHDGTTGKALGIGREHRSCHGTSCRKADQIHARSVNRISLKHGIDHLPDRQRLASVARRVIRLEPVEAGVILESGSEARVPFAAQALPLRGERMTRKPRVVTFRLDEATWDWVKRLAPYTRYRNASSFIREGIELLLKQEEAQPSGWTVGRPPRG
jgi:hypothetical protein